MVEAVMIWNEPNNLSHWDFNADPEWKLFSDMVVRAAAAVREINPELPIVLGGISPIDVNFIQLMKAQGVLEVVDVVALHGFPLDWNHWQVNEWPAKLEEVRAVARGKKIWVSEVGASSFGAEEVQAFGLERMSELLMERAERVHWYSLFDLPATWSATTRHKEIEGSSYYRHYYMGLIREDGTPKIALEKFPRNGELGICQWFHYQDHRLQAGVEWLRRLGVKHLRTGVSWADSYRENAEEWFDQQMEALDEFAVTMTLCFTPQHLGRLPHYTSPPKNNQDFVDFTRWAVNRYAKAQAGAQLEMPVAAH
ncbi:MAG: beta-xylosidase [Acidobacteriaceae bacterium]